MRAEKNGELDCIFFGERSCLSMQLMQDIIPVHSWPPKQSIFKRRTIHLALSCYSVHKREEKKSGGSHTSEGEIRKMLSTSVRSPIQTINQRFIFPFIAGAANSFRRREHYHILTSVSSSFLQI